MSSAAEESSHSDLHPAVHIGHVHLRVGDLDRATAFYRDVLGFDVTVYGADVGLPGAAFLSAGGYHHHLGLNTWHTATGGAHGTAPLRHPLPRPPRPRPRRRAPLGERISDRWGGGPRGDDLGVPLRPRRQRHRALLRPPERGVGNPQGRTIRSSGSIGGVGPHILVCVEGKFSEVCIQYRA